MKYLTNEDLIDLLRYHVGFVEQNHLDIGIDLCVNIIKEVDYDEDALKAIYAFKEDLPNASDKQAGTRIYDDLLDLWNQATSEYDQYL